MDAKIIFEAGVLEHGDMQKSFLGWCKKGCFKTKCNFFFLCIVHVYLYILIINYRN